MAFRSVRGVAQGSGTVLTRADHRRRGPNQVAAVFIAGLCAGGLAAGCKCEATNNRPYTPFGVATELRPASNATLPSAPSADEATDGTFKAIVGEQLSPPAESITIDDWEVQAPKSRRISHYLAANWDGKPGLEVVAWLVSGADPGKTSGKAPAADESLVLFVRGQTPRKLAGFPSFIPRSEACALQTTLTGTGPNTVTWDVAADCATGTQIPRSPHRSLTLLAPMQTVPVRLQLRLAEPASGERIEVEVLSRDADGDSHDDAVVTFRLWTTGLERSDGAEPPSAEARLTWLDRAAGMARDNSEPRKSFTDLGHLEMVRAKGQNTSRQVGPRVNLARRLFAYLCKEGATYRVTDVDGSAIMCGNLTSATDSWASAEVSAALTQHHYARAVLAAEQSTWFGPGVSAKAAAGLEKQLHAAIASKSVTSRLLGVRSVSPPPGPHYAPLRFVEDALYLVTDQGVQRLVNDDLQDASDEVDPWSLVAFGPEGLRLTQLGFPCNEPTITGSSQTSAGTFATALTTDILSPRPGLCEGRPVVPDIEFRPVSWTQEGLAAYVGPVAVGAPPRFRQPGSPQSNSGNWSITSGKLGLLVQSPKDAHFWQPSSDVGRLTDCVIADSGTRAACLTGNRVVVLDATAPSP